MATSLVHSLLTIGTIFQFVLLRSLPLLNFLSLNDLGKSTPIAKSSHIKFIHTILIYSQSIEGHQYIFHHGKLKDSIQKAILKHEYNSLQLIQHKFKELSHQWGHGKKNSSNIVHQFE